MNTPTTLWALMTHPLFLEHDAQIVTAPHSIRISVMKQGTKIGTTLIGDHNDEAASVAILWRDFLRAIGATS